MEGTFSWRMLNHVEVLQEQQKSDLEAFEAQVQNAATFPLALSPIYRTVHAIALNKMARHITARRAVIADLLGAIEDDLFDGLPYMRERWHLAHVDVESGVLDAYESLNPRTQATFDIPQCRDLLAYSRVLLDSSLHHAGQFRAFLGWINDYAADGSNSRHVDVNFVSSAFNKANAARKTGLGSELFWLQPVKSICDIMDKNQQDSELTSEGRPVQSCPAPPRYKHGAPLENILEVDSEDG